MPSLFSGPGVKIFINSMSGWHGCCNTTSRENAAFKVLREPKGSLSRGNFGCRCSRECGCGDSFALSIAPDTALSRPLGYDQQQFDRSLAKSRYAGALALILSPVWRNTGLCLVRPAEIFSAALITAEWNSAELTDWKSVFRSLRSNQLFKAWIVTQRVPLRFDPQSSRRRSIWNSD